MGEDARGVVTEDIYEAPFDGIGLLVSQSIGTTDFRPGTGFFIGENTLLTAWHVIGDGTTPADSVGFVHGSPTVAFVPTIPLPSPSDQLKQVVGSADLGLVLNPTGGINVISGPQEPSVFGLDAYADYANCLTWLEATGDTTQATTAGYPQTKFTRELLSDDWQIGSIVAGTMYAAQGDVDEVRTFNGRQYVSDVPFEMALDDGELKIEIEDGTDGRLDASVGQSGSPLWTYDARHDSHRAMAVAVQASQDNGLFGIDFLNNLFLVDTFTYEATLFELIDLDDFAWITGQMAAADVTQPDDVTNRVTGLFGNTYNEVITGSDYRDVLRGLGAGEGGRDILRGGLGNDIYEIGYGFGAVTIAEPEAFGVAAPEDDADTIDLRGIAFEDVRMERGFLGSDLYIYVRNPADGDEDVITITRQFTYGSAIERLQFDEGYIDLTNGLILAGDDAADTLDGTNFDDVIFGFGGDDALLGRAGNDTLNGGLGNDSLYGGLDDDTYEYGRGYGSDGIAEDGGFDTVVLTDLDFDDIRLQRDIGVNSAFLRLYVRDGNQDVAGQELGFGYQFSSNTDTRIERLITADGIEIDLTGGLYFRGTDSNNSMAGTEHDDFIQTLGGNDLIRAGGGDDFLEGGAGNDGLEGGYGGDTYVFGPDFGQDTINEIGRYFGGTDIGPIDTIHFEGISAASVRFEPDFLFWNLSIYVGEGSENSIYIPSQYSNYNADGSPLIERVTFGDGTSIDLTVAGATDNALPVGEAQSTIADFGEVQSFEVGTLLATVEDADPDADLSFAGISNAQGGTATVEGDQVIFTPDPGHSGPASFDYLVSDGIATIPVSVTIDYDNVLIRYYDDGRVQTTTYANGGPAASQVDDAANVHAWDSFTLDYDDGGARTQREMTYDDGRVLSTRFEDDQRVDASMQDVDDRYNWDSYLVIYDDTGTRTDRGMVFDDGRLAETQYSDGVRASTLVRDAVDSFDWTTIERRFDTGGTQTGQTNTFDDGRVLETDYLSGVRSVAMMNDSGDAYGWDHYTVIYDDAGTRISRLTTYDDGREVVTFYDDAPIG